jgi:hypothetical protein
VGIISSFRAGTVFPQIPVSVVKTPEVMFLMRAGKFRSLAINTNKERYFIIREFVGIQYGIVRE